MEEEEDEAITAAAEAAPVVGDDDYDDDDAAACRSYGLNLGIAFQLIDDALDYGGIANTLGKNTGDDFREGKITLPVLLAFARGSEAERDFWRRVLEDVAQEQGDLARAQELLARHGAIDATVARAEAYAQRARQSLAPFPYSRAKQAMLDLLDFCTARAY